MKFKLTTMAKACWAVGLAVVPFSAMADPVSLIAAIAATVVQNVWIKVAIIIAVAAYGDAQSRKKKRSAYAASRAAALQSITERGFSALSSAPYWRIRYGRSVGGGDVVNILTSDKTAYREDGTTYTRPDALKHLVIELAHHEVQSINEIYLDGIPVGPLDGNGYAQAGSAFYGTRLDTRTSIVPGSGSLVVGQPVVTVINAMSQTGSGDNTVVADASGNISLSGGNLTINNSNPLPVEVTYTVQADLASVRIQKHLGTTTQTVDTYLNGLFPTEWDSSHRLRGAAYVVLTLDLEDARFQGGIPNPTFDVSGKKCYDPRTTLTVYTENPAIIIRDWLMSVWGYSVLAADIDDASVIAAANACDARYDATVQGHSATFTADASTDRIAFTSERWFSTGDGVRLTNSGGALPAGLSAGVTYYIIEIPTGSRTVFQLATSVANAQAGTAINFTSNGTGTHTCNFFDYAAFTCNGSFTTGDPKELVLDNLADSMAGSAVNSGNWFLQAGVWTASVMDLTEADLDGLIDFPNTDTDYENLYNGMRGLYVPRTKSAAIEYNNYSNATFVTADGEALFEDKNLPFTDSVHRARNICRINVERNRNGQTINFPAKLRAWPLQIGDRVRVSSAEYGIGPLKYFRLTDWQFMINSVVMLTLQEDDAQTYDLSDAAVADPTPNTTLANPWIVAPLSFNGATTQLIKQADGSFIPAVTVKWNASTDPFIADGSGRIVLNWKRPTPVGGTLAWNHIEVPGDQLQTTFTGMREGDVLTLELFALNSNKASGPPTYLSLTIPVTVPSSFGSDLVLVPHGVTASIVVRGNTVTKIAGATAWDTGVYSRNSYLGGCAVRFTAPAGALVQVGLNGDPATDATDTGIDFAFRANGAGNILIYESGSLVYTHGSTHASTDVFEIIYDNCNVKYKLNGTVLRTKRVAMNLSLALDSSLNTVGSEIRNLSFDPVSARNKTFQVIGVGASASGAPSGAGSIIDVESGEVLLALTRSWGYVAISRATGLVTASAVYDVYTSAANATSFAAALNALTDSSLVLVATYDEPQANHLLNGMDAALLRHGASVQVLANANFKYRAAYALIGVGNCGAGNGVEQYRGAADSAADAWAQLTCSLTPDGKLLSSGQQTTRDPVETYTAFSVAAQGTGARMVGNVIFKDRSITQTTAWDASIRSTFGINGACFAMAVAPTNTVSQIFGLNTDPATDASYTSIDYAFYMRSDGKWFVYESGSVVAGNGTTDTYSAGDHFSVEYTNVAVIYRKNGTIVFQHAVPPGLTLYFDTSLEVPDTRMIGVDFGPLNRGARGNLLDSGSWITGSSGTQGAATAGGALFAAIGDSGEDSIVMAIAPDGVLRPCWKATSGDVAGTTADGGWDGGTVPIDSTKPYRFSVWICMSAFSGSVGNVYFGCGPNTVAAIATGTADANPYFMAGGRGSFAAGRWYLFVGHALPSGYGTTPPSPVLSGIWDGATGQKVSDGTDFKWVSGIATSMLRAYQYYSDASNVQLFWQPRLELMDGTEPTIDELLSVAKTGATKPLTFSEAYSLNGQFTDWTLGATPPDNWVVWSNPASTLSKETSSVRSGPNAVRMSNASSSNDVGYVWLGDWHSAPLAAGSYFELQADAYVVTNTSGGSPLVYVELYTNSGLSTFRSFQIPFVKTQTGVWQSIKKLLSVNDGELIYGMRIYLMASWSSASGGRWLGDIIVDNLLVELRTPADTAQLKDGSATPSRQASYPSDGTHSWSSGSGSIPPQQQIGILSYTNNTGRAVVVEMSASCNANGSGGTGTASGRPTIDMYCDDGTSVIREKAIYLTGTDAMAGGLLTETVAAGATINFRLYSLLKIVSSGTWNAGSINWSEASMRLTVMGA